MQTVTTIGLDIAKSVFQVHGVDGAGQVVIRRQLKRRSVLTFFQKLPPCLVGIEACASAHHWSRERSLLPCRQTHPRGRGTHARLPELCPIGRLVGVCHSVVTGGQSEATSACARRGGREQRF